MTDNSKQVVPYAGSSASKKEQIADMFNSVAHRYDFLNRFFSLGIDQWWRKKAIQQLANLPPNSLLLDVATGTADVAIAAAQKLRPKQVIGIDISTEMLALGEQKVVKAGLANVISLQVGDAENLPFADNYFDAITISFGIRNFENLSQGLCELYRVLKPGGKLVVLEFSKPQAFPIKPLYQFYFRYILPVIGKWVSKDDSAYTYLPASVAAFPEGEHFIHHLSTTGFKSTQCIPLTFGISSLYTGVK